MNTLALQLQNTRYRSAFFVIGASFLMALAGKVSFVLPFTPVQMTLQNNAILLAGMLLGARRGFYATALLLVYALIGLPVLSTGATVGIARFLGPTGGYLIGFALSAYVCGRLYEKRQSFLGAFCALSAGLLVQYFCGALWLGQFVGYSNAIICGVAPFILGDTLFNLGFSSLRAKHLKS